MKKIFIAGHNGLVGGALIKFLREKKKNKLFFKEKKKLDLTNQKEVFKYFNKNKFDQVYIAAAKVGGIYANNKYPADFIYQNLMINCNLINSSFLTGVKKILYLGSNCFYPKFTVQPMKENQLLSGKIEPTNEPFAIAKIAGLKLCESYNRQYKQKKIDFRTVVPTNLYGVGDNYDPKNSHVIPSLIRKFHLAKKKKLKSVTLWGSGNAIREFLYVDDLAKYCIEIMNLSKKKYEKYTDERCSHINIGTGKGIKISKLANKISNIVGYEGKIKFNKSYPDGHPKKILNINKLKKITNTKFIDLNDGLRISYSDFLTK
tara:strand:- start:4460 stop:5410 length:951 start_codon:yes stop_codon:yes gene_type:complete